MSVRDGVKKSFAFLISSGVAVTMALSRSDANGKELGDSERCIMDRDVVRCNIKHFRESKIGRTYFGVFVMKECLS